MPRSEPGGASVSPTPIWIEQPEPGGVSWTTRKSSVGRVVDVEREAGLLGVERERAVDVGDGQDDDLDAASFM